MAGADFPPEELVRRARTALMELFHRWREEQDLAESGRLWLLVEEMERRVQLCMERAGALKPHYCPKCNKRTLVEYINDDGSPAAICRKCGWTNRDILLSVIRNYSMKSAARTQKRKQKEKETDASAAGSSGAQEE